MVTPFFDAINGATSDPQLAGALPWFHLETRVGGYVLLFKPRPSPIFSPSLLHPDSLPSPLTAISLSVNSSITHSSNSLHHSAIMSSSTPSGGAGQPPKKPSGAGGGQPPKKPGSWLPPKVQRNADGSMQMPDLGRKKKQQPEVSRAAFTQVILLIYCP